MTESKKSENELKRDLYASEEIFRLLVESVKDYAIFMLDPDGMVMTWNAGAQRIKGYKASEIIGKHFSEFYTEEAKSIKHPQNELVHAVKDGRYEETGWRVRKDGSQFWANVTITAVYDQDVLRGFAKVTRDLTERLLADQEREATAKKLDQTNAELTRALEVKSRFLSTISHEVRTPMSAIIGMSEVLADLDLGEETNGAIKNIFVSSQRLLQLLNNLLDSANMESGEIALEERTFPIRAVLGDVRQLVNREAKEKGLRIHGGCDAQIPENVVGDELKLRQVLLNLAHNAVKFTASGEVRINAELASQSEQKLNVRFTVADTGIGIREEDKSKLFNAFTQAEDSTKRVYGGSGLGLNISKQLVERMGGTIGFDSTFGSGSAFTFEVPFSLEGHQK